MESSGLLANRPEKSRLSIKLPFEYTSSFAVSTSDDNAKLTAFMNRRLADVDGFVLFDNDQRFQVDLPPKWPELLKKGSVAPLK